MAGDEPVLVRTLRRGLTGVELWNGNRETLRNLLRRDPQHNILLWSWTNHARTGGATERPLRTRAGQA